MLGTTGSNREGGRFLKRLIGVAFSLFLCGETAVFADGLVVPFVGSSASDAHTERVTTMGLSVAFMAGGVFGFELDLARTARAKTDSVFVRDSRVTTGTGNVIIGIPLGPIRPYAVGGVGWIRNDLQTLSGAREKGEGLAADFGGGIMGFFGDTIGARFDLRYFRILSSGKEILDFRVDDFDFLRVSGGVVFRF